MRLRYTSVVVLLLLLVACATPPRGASGGRRPISETGRNEPPAAGIALASMDEFTRQCASQLISDLKDLPELAQSEYRSTVVLGDIVNQTDRIPTRDFEAFRDRLRQFLQNSKEFRNNVRIVSNRAAIQSQRDRERGNVQTSGGQDIYDPQTTYFLNGKFYELRRGSTALYQMSFTLVRDFDGTEVWTNVPYDAKFED